MDWYTDSNDSLQYISIFSSEVEFIAGLAAEWGAIETGGEFFGLWSHAGRAVVMLATPPAPQAVHETARFRQDVEYFTTMSDEINKQFGIQFIGDYHSHHFLGLEHPSAGDANHIKSIAARNHLPRIIQIILTNNGKSPSSFHLSEKDLIYEGSSHGYAGPTLQREMWGRAKEWRRKLWPLQRRGSVERVVINSFFYRNAVLGQWIKCPLKVIPGVSPIRKAVTQGNLPIGQDSHIFFPLERITYEEVRLPEESNTQDWKISDTLMRQVVELPEVIQREISVAVDEGFIVIHLPLTDMRKASVVFADEWPYPVKAVFLRDGEREGAEVTEDVLPRGRATRLSTIYKGLIPLVEDVGRNEPRSDRANEPNPSALKETGGNRNESPSAREIREANDDDSRKGA